MQLNVIKYFLFTITVFTVYARDVTKTLTVTNGGHWGTWQKKVFCPESSYATGFKLKIESYKGIGDDTALNDVGVICSDGTFISGQISRFVWGSWSELSMCPSVKYLSGFKMRAESFQGFGDDTAANSLQFKCRSHRRSTPLPVLDDMGGYWGTWGSWSEECPVDSQICGLQVKYESWRTGQDDTGLNDIRFFCCEDYFGEPY